MKIQFILSFLLSILLFSCASNKSIVYFGNSDTSKTDLVSSYESRFKSDDLLSIQITGPDSEAAVPFNLYSPTDSKGNGEAVLSAYLVDNKGNISFPLLGIIKVAGLSKEELINHLKSKLVDYIKDPIINIRIVNFKVTVNGEVTRPGTFNVASERISIIDALALAGDLTIYGKRNNVLIIREFEGKKKFIRVDITKTDFINSEYYYLQQNDVVYVEPNQTKVNSSVVGSNVSTFLSIISILVTVFVVIIK